MTTNNPEQYTPAKRKKLAQGILSHKMPNGKTFGEMFKTALKNVTSKKSGASTSAPASPLALDRSPRPSGKKLKRGSGLIHDALSEAYTPGKAYQPPGKRYAS